MNSILTVDHGVLLPKGEQNPRKGVIRELILKGREILIKKMYRKEKIKSKVKTISGCTQARTLSISGLKY